MAEGFKVPEPAILERLNLTPRRPDIRPAVRRSTVIAEAERRLSLAEKQLIQALLQGPEIALVVQPLWEGDFLTDIWSAPVLEKLVKQPGTSVEIALESVQDDELRKEVRAAFAEPFGRITPDQALAALKRLRDVNLVKKLGEIREQLKQYGAGAAPVELMTNYKETVAKMSRTEAFKA